MKVNSEIKAFVAIAKRFNSDAIKFNGNSLYTVTPNCRILLRLDGSSSIKESFVIPISALEYVISFPENNEVNIKHEKGVISLKCGRSRTKITTVDRDFSEMPQKKSEAIVLSAEDVDSIKRVSTAASDRAPQPQATAVTLMESEGKVDVFAVDGYRLAYTQLKAKPFKNGETNIKVPKRELSAILSVFAKGCNLFETTDSRKVIFENDKFTVMIPMVYCNSMDYKSQFAVEGTKIWVNKSEMENALRRVLKFNSSVTAPITILHFGEELKMEVKFLSYQGEESFTIEREQKDNERKETVGINGNYLLDALRSLTSEKISIVFRGSLTPLIMSDDNLKYLVVPIRIARES